MAMQPPPLAPYPPQQAAHPQPYCPPYQGAGQSSQIICQGCRTLLIYAQGATNVKCALCNYMTPVPHQGTEMAQLICGGCHTLLMYVRGASSVECSCCRVVNLAMEVPMAHINCAGCGLTLMYTYGAQSVKCAVCDSVTHVTVGGTRMQIATQPRPYSAPPPSNLAPAPSRSQTTVVVQNPMTLDESGKLVQSVAVGVSDKKTT